MRVYSSFSELFDNQRTVSDLSVFNADCYRKNENGVKQRLELDDLLVYCKEHKRNVYIDEFLDFITVCKKAGKEYTAYEELRKLSPGKECYTMRDFVKSTMLLPSKSKRTIQYYVIFDKLGINVNSVENRRIINRMDDRIGFHPTARYDDFPRRKQLMTPAPTHGEQKRRELEEQFDQQNPFQEGEKHGEYYRRREEFVKKNMPPQQRRLF